MFETGKEILDFKFIGGSLCLDFANAGEVLHSYDDLIAWLERAGALSTAQNKLLREAAAARPEQAAAAFRRAELLQTTVRRVFLSQGRGTPPAERDLRRVSGLVRRSAKHRALRNSSDGYRWEWEDAGRHLDWPLWVLAWSAADLLTSDRQSYVRVCAAPDCGWLFLDASRNHSRRWCDMADCGNRAKARRNYARRRASRSA